MTECGFTLLHHIGPRSVRCFVKLIQTASKEKLPKGFSYPLRAEALSAALEGAVQFDNAQFWFSWRDEYWASKWREKIDALGDVVLFEIHDSYFGSGKDIRLYAVPSEYSEGAREELS